VSARRALAAALVAAAPIMAEACPRADDLGAGIRVTFADGTTEIHRAARPGRIAVDGRRPDGTGWHLELAQGLFVLGREEVPADPAFALDVNYGRLPQTLPRPEPMGRLQIAATVTDATGQRMEVQSHRYGALGRLALGPCSLDVIEATIGYGDPVSYEEGVLWLPALGIGLLAWNGAPGQARPESPAVSIEALR
jgi:hypothetical protein